MRIVITGSSGHLGEGLVRALTQAGHEVVGIDLLDSPFTACVGSICDRDLLRDALQDAAAVVHAATLHKPHIISHSFKDFVYVNIAGTLCLLEEAAAAGVKAFVFVSTTSAFGRALNPPPGGPAAWITEDTSPLPKNIYGVTKVTAEELCELFHRDHGLPVVVLRTSRFFPEDDDALPAREIDPANLKVNELLHRRVDVADVVTACQLAIERSASIGFGRYVVSATTPFQPTDLAALRIDAPGVVGRLFPAYQDIYRSLGWHMSPSIDRVYVNLRARRDLGWQPAWDFRAALDRLAAGEEPRSRLAVEIGTKGYHSEPTGVYTTRSRPTVVETSASSSTRAPRQLRTTRG
jgi:UDP-glucose 4-epimerase